MNIQDYIKSLSEKVNQMARAESSPKISNPYMAMAGAYNMLNTQENFNQVPQVQTAGQIGSTMVGGVGQRLGDTAIKSGNPYAMLAGAALKVGSGMADNAAYAFGKRRDIGFTRDYEGNAAFDLEDEARAVNEIKPGRTAFQALKKGGFHPLNLGLSLASYGRARSYKRQAMGDLSRAQNNFNQSAIDYNTDRLSNAAYDARVSKEYQNVMDMFGGNISYY